MRDADELQRMVLAYKGALRDANPLLGTLEDVGNVLGQTDDEGLLDAARRVVEQRDAAVARLRELELEALARREAERVYAGVCVTPAQRAQIYSDVTVRAQSEIAAWERDITGGAPVLPGPNETPYQRAKRLRDEARAEHHRTGEALRLAEEAMQDATLTEEESAERKAATLAWLGSLPGSAEPTSPADELDPVAALERVLGTRWTGDGIKHLLFIGQESVPSLQVWRAEHSRRLAGRGEQWAWYVRSITRGVHSYGHAFGRDGQVEASVACFRAISERRSVLPKSCPGLAVLTPAERAAFLEVPHG